MKFKERSHVCIMQIQGEAAADDVEATASYWEGVAIIIDEDNCAEDNN